ncbi:hypothetical protein [Kitasatospora viridis]|uniref:Uncharacterized protein n=1 Tax=Kitasatospora viridis TaxID=281105 RepID=A0A561SA60_9ACTN|nr:hypothetical protein [Kitasatospora viridis]TWF71766.1 hypothetical protein FHX73_18137 [Kitasatospora viridis]
MSGFPPPPTDDPGRALADPLVAQMQRLHNWLAVHRPVDLAAAREGESAVDVALRLMALLPGTEG